MSSTCPVCGVGHIVIETLSEKFDYLGFQLEAEKVEEFCDSCGTLLQSPETIRANLRSVQKAKIRHDGLLTGDEIRVFRESFHITQAIAASLFGGGKVAFSKYECDEIAHNVSMDRLLRLAIAVPENLLRLALMSGTELSEQTTSAIEDNLSKRFFEAARQAQKKLDRKNQVNLKPKLTIVRNDFQMVSWDNRMRA